MHQISRFIANGSTGGSARSQAKQQYHTKLKGGYCLGVQKEPPGFLRGKHHGIAADKPMLFSAASAA